MGLIGRLRRSGHIRHDVVDRFRRLVPTGRILDIPAGTGVNARFLAEAGYAVQAADIFPDDCRGVACDRVDMTRPLPYDDASFDGILHSEGIEHVDNQVGVLLELARVLRPGGVLIVTTPNLLHLEGRLSFMLSGHLHPRRSMVATSTGYWAASPTEKKSLYFGHVFLINYFQLRFYLSHVGLDVVGVDTTRYSWKSLCLAPILWLPVVLGTRRLVCHRKFGAPPELRGQILGEVLGPHLLFGRKLIMVARKPTHPSSHVEADVTG